MAYYCWSPTASATVNHERYAPKDTVYSNPLLRRHTDVGRAEGDCRSYRQPARGRQKRSAARYDTAYIAKPEQRWTVKLRANMSGTDLNADGVMSGEPFRTKLEAEAKATVGASVSYRGLSLSLMLNPAKLSGRDRDYEFNFTSYGRRFGFDFTFTQAKTSAAR